MKNVKDLLKKNDIIRVSKDDTLSQALGHLSSSHDAAFVMDEKDNFLGVINPYYALIQSSAYDGDTKTENCLHHPPRIYEVDTIGRIAKMMSESRIHYLPVFNDKEEFVGITSARRLLKLMRNAVDRIYLKGMIESKSTPYQTVKESDMIAQAINLFKEHKISKLLVLDNNKKLVGVLSYYDIVPYMIAPGQRKKGGRGSDERVSFKNEKIKNYMQKTLQILTEDKTAADAIDIMLEKEKGSVIVVDENGQPLGIITTRNLLDILHTQEDQKQVQLTTKNFNDAHISVITELVDYVSDHIQKEETIRSAEVIAEEEKTGVLFRISIHLIPEKGKMLVYEREGKDLPGMLRELKGLVRQEK